MKVNRKPPKRAGGGLLFPGFLLNQTISSPRACATIVGHAFEDASASLLGGKRSATDGTADVCPDVICDEKALAVESKGCQTGHAFKVPINQIDRYLETRLWEAKNGTDTRIVYCLWAYKDKSLTKDRPKAGTIVSRVVDACVRVHVLDLNVIDALRVVSGTDSTAPATCSIRNYASWRGLNGEDYHVLNVGHRWLARVTELGVNVLEELELEKEGYIYSKEKRKVGPFVIDGVDFQTGEIDVISLTRPFGYVEHPGAEAAYLASLDEAPF